MTKLPLPAVPKPLVIVVVTMAAVGLALGAAWAALAPAAHGAVALTRTGDRVQVYLGRESDHFFVSAAIMFGLLIAFGLVAAVWAWQFRQMRGPTMVGALALGGLIAGCFAAGTGLVVARLRYGAPVDVASAPVSPDHRVEYVVEAPSVFFGSGPLVAVVTVLVPAALAALTYAVLAAAASRDDLGVDPMEPTEPSVPEAVGEPLGGR